MLRNVNHQRHFFPEALRMFVNARLYELIGFALLTLSGFIFLSLVSYNSSDRSWNSIVEIHTYHNIFNSSGALVADLLHQPIGMASFFIPVILLIWGGLYLFHRPVAFPLRRLGAALGMALSLSTFLASIQGIFPILLPGFLGALLINIINQLCALAKLSALTFVASILFFVCTVVTFIYAASLSFADWRFIFSLIARMYKSTVKVFTVILQFLPKTISFRSKDRGNQNPYLEMVGQEEQPLSLEVEDNFEIVHPKPNVPIPRTSSKSAAKSARTLTLSKEIGTYHLPPVDLLDEPIHREGAQVMTKQELEDRMHLLSQVLADYGISGKIMRARTGPVVTIYEFMPAPGIKSSRIIGLADDIARSMSALSARIAIIPGQSEIGIELPNEKRQTVHLYELLSHPDFEKEESRLTMALGKNISGAPVFADLARMPHMIVAGTTGSGKSVAVNGMILSLLYRHSPATCRLIMIDPKMLELSIYNNIPHLLAPVVTDPKKAIYALKWTVKEMENRYHAMSHLSVRNIEGYNFALAKAKAENRKLTRRVQTGFDSATGQPTFEDQEIDTTPLPYIVVIVDEMADLMMVAGKDIEAAVQRLAQMARAAGIHVIMATQRPSVDVITGTIKANFPTRIGFQVTSKFDSKTILGEQGAEQLLGRGDMLFMEAGGKIQRVHGPFVSDDEVERIVTFLKSQSVPNYVETITEESDDFGLGAIGSEDEESDDLFQQAVDILKKEGKASTSFIQRRLQIGYNRAARIMEQMEAEGIVSAPNHVGKREILL